MLFRQGLRGPGVLIDMISAADAAHAYRFVDILGTDNR